MIKLTKKQKAEFVARDYFVGRIHAMEFVLNLPEYSTDTKCQELFNRLFEYENFGDGDDLETKLWEAIINYLDLKDTYDLLWSEEEQIKNIGEDF